MVAHTVNRKVCKLFYKLHVHVIIMNDVGETIKTSEKGSVHIIPFDVANPSGPERTDSSFRSNAKSAISLNMPVSAWQVVYGMEPHRAL